MSRTIETRLRKLELMPGRAPDRRVFRVIGTEPECDAQVAELIKSGQACDADMFIARVVV